MDSFGDNIRQRHEHEGTFVHARVRQDEIGRIPLLRPVEQQVQIEHARRVALTVAASTCLHFERLEQFEEFFRRQRGVECDGGVQVRALRWTADRIGLVEWRQGVDANARRSTQTVDRALEICHAIAEVRTQGDTGPRLMLRHAASLQLHCAVVSAPPTLPPTLVSAPPTLPPELRSAVPGPRSHALARRLAAVESRNVTCLDPGPVFWERAAGANVWDVDGNRYVDLTAAFGVANVGHAHPRVVEAVADQADRLLHAMGDVHPADVKVALLEELARRFPGGGDCRTVLGSSGSDAVESALKTALLATGKPGVVAFKSGYHGLALGALDATWRPFFREPFSSRLPEATVFARFGDADTVLRAAHESPAEIGAVLVEPIQGRGGDRIPPHGFLTALRTLCDARGWLPIADEVYTGFGRTGRWFACDHEGVVPDLLCVGKGLASGMPLSACIGRNEVMDAWPASGGEALHTSTFLGHPPSCAAALASLAVIEEEKLVERAADTGAAALSHLRARLDATPGISDVRGQGLLIAVECEDPARSVGACARALADGVIVLASGDRGEVVSITPPLSIEPVALEHALDVVVEALCG